VNRTQCQTIGTHRWAGVRSCAKSRKSSGTNTTRLHQYAAVNSKEGGLLPHQWIEGLGSGEGMVVVEEEERKDECGNGQPEIRTCDHMTDERSAPHAYAKK
jgi:hypothetical protein